MTPTPFFRSIARRLGSPGLALGVLGFLAVYGSLSVWLPEPAQVALLGERPFSAPVFLAAGALLFASLLACTCVRTAHVAALRAGESPPGALEIESGDADQLDGFLASQGFRGAGAVRRRFGFALFAGWLLHVALLVLIAGVLVQLAFHDGGIFELVPGETVRLSDAGVVLRRQRGPLAPESPPNFRVGLVEFDPYRHQAGYAPDRLSRLRIETRSGVAGEWVLDRAAGVEVEGVVVYQATVAGLALVLDVPGDGLRTVHLQNADERRAAAEVTDPAGQKLRFEVRSERDLDTRRGTGALTIRVFEADRLRPLGAGEIAVGERFDFGPDGATLVDVARWSGFSYARSPGLPAVFCGFALVLAASLLLAFPAGVARIEPAPAGTRARVWLNRGLDVVRQDWARFMETGSAGPDDGAPSGTARVPDGQRRGA